MRELADRSTQELEIWESEIVYRRHRHMGK